MQTSEAEDAQVGAERRVAAGRVATWFGGELGSLLRTLRQTVAEAPLESSLEVDQAAAERIPRGRPSVLGVARRAWLAP